MCLGTISLTENSPGAAALWTVGPDSTSVFSQAKAIFAAKEAAPSNPSSDAVPTAPAAYVAAAAAVSESIPSQKSPVATTSPLRRRQSTEATPDVFVTPPPHQKQEPDIAVVETRAPVAASVPPPVSIEAEVPPQRGSVKDMALKYDKTAAASSAPVSKLDGSRRVSTGDAPIRPDLPITEAETPPPPAVAPVVNKRRSSLSGLTQTTSCAVCGKPLYPMDSQMKLDKVSIHSSCARCHECKCTVSLSNYAKSERNGAFVLLCQTHYMRQTYETKGSYSMSPNSKQTK